MRNLIKEVLAPVARFDDAFMSGNQSYYFSDHLGSSNVVTSAPGVIEEESDFYPFGGERVITDTLADQNYKFTGKERDPETNLDYFGARYYAFNFGRFTTPDEFAGGPVDAFSSGDPLPPGPLPYAEITNPQSLNKYTYTYNHPLRYTDPNGHIVDTLLDIAFTTYDAAAVVADVVTGSDELSTDLKALGADGAAILLPGVTGAGMAVRAESKLDKLNDIRRIAQEGAEREAKGLAQAEKKLGIKLERDASGKAVKSAPHDVETGKAIRDDKGKTSIFDGKGTDKYGNKVGVEVSKKTQSRSEQARKADQAKRQETLVNSSNLTSRNESK